MSKRRFYASLFTTIILGFSCQSTEELYQLTIESDSGTHLFYVEIADNDEKRQKGLMERRSLPEKRGMLFIFERDQRLSFWMKNTYIPLSIAYIDSQGSIKDIYDMYPHNLATVSSLYPVRYALEVNQGVFDNLGIKPGDQVVLPSKDPSHF